MPAGHKKHKPVKMNSKSDHHANGSTSKSNNHHNASVKIGATPSAKVPSSKVLLSPTFVSSSIPSMSVSQPVMPSPSSSVSMAGAESSTSMPVSPLSSSPSLPLTASIIGGIIGGVVICLSIVIYALFRRIKKKKGQQRQKGMMGHDDNTHTNAGKNGGWNVTRSWSTLDSNSNKCATDMNPPPPAYYSSTRAKKRWTQDSMVSKQSSFVKQYNPQLAYSPSQSTILQMDHEGVSPSHTLVDTSGSSWLHQKELSLPEYEEDQQQQRRSIQPYQAQLDISSSFSDALDTPGPYQSGILLHTQEDLHPSSTS
ncbi:hypothetical protein BCR42DRAFT_443505 [Absidia repens]|uniref:Uncharacterized protein n=1 Tax=Absidia repens TaxID=90262 RepID=A0A1X2HZ40_9FUNG|nr:hypothetical protein BCR42DRAFT_443505 [Absidia repens]